MTDRDDEGQKRTAHGGMLWLDDDLTFEDLDLVGTWRIDLERRSIAVDSTGRIQLDPNGVPMDTTLSTRRWGEVFTDWLTLALGGAIPPPEDADSSGPHRDA